MLLSELSRVGTGLRRVQANEARQMDLAGIDRNRLSAMNAEPVRCLNADVLRIKAQRQGGVSPVCEFSSPGRDR